MRDEINKLNAVIDALEKLHAKEKHPDIKIQYAKQILQSKVKKGKLEGELNNYYALHNN